MSQLNFANAAASVERETLENNASRIKQAIENL